MSEFFTLHYWFMFPISLLVAITAMSSGVGGAVFFAPIFMMILKLSPEVAIGTAIITEVFGFGSGIVAYIRRKLIDYKTGNKMLFTVLPAAIIGSLVSPLLNPVYLKTIFAVAIILIAISLFFIPKEKDVKNKNNKCEVGTASPGSSTIKDATGKTYHYKICHKQRGRMITTTGGFFVGLISMGLGEINAYYFMSLCRIPLQIAAATSVYLISIASIAAAGTHVYNFFQHDPATTIPLVVQIIIYTIPGVIIGGQIGPILNNIVPQHIMHKIISILFAFIGSYMLITTFLF